MAFWLMCPNRESAPAMADLDFCRKFPGRSGPRQTQLKNSLLQTKWHSGRLLCTSKDVRDLANLNWRDSNVRRCIAACLVNVVYLLQQDNEKTKKKEEMPKKTKKREEMPNEWCALLKFKREEVIMEKDRIFGAIFRRDRGHSLGAATAIAITRKLGKEERDKIEAHLFNPPFLSPRLPEVIFFKKVGKFLLDVDKGMHSNHLPLLETVYKKIEGARKWAQVSSGLKDDTVLLDFSHDFIAIGNWIPNIYVNKNDFICSSYIRYFKVMGRLYEKKVQSLHEHMKYIFCYEVAKKRTPWHLLPSARLFIKETNKHCLQQWWSRDLKLEGKTYVPPAEALRAQT
ncbi:hypothetical protein SUGI_0475180 [Cryptomeria japonica]|nr:hypothetical protein SUGI_0475180 [Cryptomeria japonica]